MRFLIFAFMSMMVGTTILAKHHEKKSTQEYFILYDDACDHPSDSCTRSKKLPSKMEKHKKFEHIPSYVGTIQTQFSEKNEATIDAWDHYFSDSKACEVAAKKLEEICAQ